MILIQSVKILFKTNIILLIFFNLTISTMAENYKNTVLPRPTKISFTKNKFRINKSFKIYCNNSSVRSKAGIENTTKRLGGKTGIFFDDYLIGYDVPKEFNDVGKSQLFENESYNLKIKEALKFIEENKKPSKEWLSKAENIIEMSKISYAQVEINIVEAIKNLINSI